MSWVILVCVCLLASAAGTFAATNRKLGITLISLFAGFFVGMTIVTPFGSKLQTVSFYGITIGTGVLFAIVSYWLETALIIIATSFVGSYMLVRGASCYAPQGKWTFPNEFNLQNEHLQGTFYVYLGGIVTLAVLGGIYQKR